MDWMDWLSYTAVTPKASLQSDANNNDNNDDDDDNNGNSTVILSARGGNGGNSHIMPIIAQVSHFDLTEVKSYINGFIEW